MGSAAAASRNLHGIGGAAVGATTAGVKGLHGSLAGARHGSFRQALWDTTFSKRTEHSLGVIKNFEHKNFEHKKCVGHRIGAWKTSATWMSSCLPRSRMRGACTYRAGDSIDSPRMGVVNAAKTAQGGHIRVMTIAGDCLEAAAAIAPGLGTFCGNDPDSSALGSA